jgi:nucleotide-binding universal stress UspA family protein
MSEFAPKQILCPVDLSASSDKVLIWARLLAVAFGARVEILHADWSESPRYFTEDQVASLASQEAARHQHLHRSLQELAHRTLGTEVAFSISVLEGHAVQVITRWVQHNPPDLIVMGSHGHGAVARLLLGSVAENVVREAVCPTLIVKSTEHKTAPPQVHRVLCPVNFTSSAQECAELSSVLASAVGAELNILHAVEPGDSRDNQVQQQLCQWTPQSARARCRLSEVVVHGNAAKQIVLFARKNSVDLIVLGAEHSSFLEFTTLGRTTERVLRHGPCSVLLLPHVQHG